MTKTFWTLAGFLLIACSAGMAQSDQPSMAEIAKQNRASKKTAKVLTEDDIPQARPAAASPAGASAKDGAASAASPAKTSAGEAGKAAPASKSAASVSELKDALHASIVQRDGWQHSAQRYEELLAKETDAFRRQMYQDALDGDRRNAALYQKKIDQLQADLAAAQKAAPQSIEGPAGASGASGSSPSANAASGGSSDR
ncbi:MAG: hypothetical protein LAO20_02855 [Acidobacteriia bacterium]|nr:hypothetical protein [Terriglobia bacterium]